VKLTECESVFYRRIPSQDTDREILADVLDPTALSDRPEPQRNRLIKAAGGNFRCVLDSFGIAEADGAMWRLTHTRMIARVIRLVFASD
jgi:hypothetical protein